MIRNKSLNRIVMLYLILVVLFTFTACTEKETIKIGVVGAMTGPNSDLSVSGRRGVEMAVDEINQSGGLLGRTIELVVKDDQNDRQIAKKMDQAFVDENIYLVIGHYTSGMVIDAIEYYTENKLLMLSPTISSDVLTGKDDYFIRLSSSTVEQASILIDYIKVRDDKNFVVLFDERNAGFTDQFVENFSTLFLKHLGSSPVIVSFNPAIQSSEALALEKTYSKDPQGVLVLASAEDSARVAQQLINRRPTIHLYGPLWANTPELLKKGGTSVENMVLVGAIDMENTDEPFVQFKSNYAERYGDLPSFSAMYSYEAMNVLAESIKRANSLDATAIKKEMLTIADFEGVLGRISLNRFGDISRKYMLFRIKDGQLKVVQSNE